MRPGKSVRRLSLWLVVTLGCALPALAQRETVIPQIADGAGIVRTKLDIRNLGTAPIGNGKLKLYFYRQDGTPWALATTLGTSSEFLLDVGRNQVLRFETLGQSGGAASGYAVLRNTEGNSSNLADFRTSVSVYYDVLNDSGRLVDTVSVPAGQPTLRFSVPVEGDVAKLLYSGLAIVNLASGPNTVTLKLWNAFPPFGSDASDGGTATMALQAREQRARFLGSSGLFEDKTTFKGTLVGTAEKPVAVLGLLQTAVTGGVQYATLSPEYLDALHTESALFLADGMKLDADALRVPYATLEDFGSYDLHYQFISSTVRNFVPQNGATLASLGQLTVAEFNNLTVENLQARTYGSLPIELSDFTNTLNAGYSIALRTSLGRFAKVRIAQIVVTGPSKDLVVSVYVFR
jgi:hypothetical protein